ncbi:hypothetical protein BDW69DRAFT_63616 [Aspergillus filifer]
MLRRCLRSDCWITCPCIELQQRLTRLVSFLTDSQISPYASWGQFAASAHQRTRKATPLSSRTPWIGGARGSKRGKLNASSELKRTARPSNDNAMPIPTISSRLLYWFTQHS